jgi:BlaI family transcriptional regulator, penicillinase repressor
LKVAQTRISEAEWRVMQVMWDRQSATAAEVIAALSPQIDWNHRTIRTLLARLVDKGVLQAIPDGNRYVYRTSVSRAACVRDEGRSFLERVFGGNVGELLVHFADQADIPPEQIAHLKAILDQKRQQGS